MTLERVRSGFLHIGIRLRSCLFVVWSELLTLAPGADDKRLVDGIRASLNQ
jgi:hypothetical protein